MAVFTQSWLAGLLCVLSGFLIDVDHIIEYAIHWGLKDFNPKSIYWACVKFSELKDENQKLYLFFHAVEAAVLLWIAFLFSQNIYLLSIALGYTGHMLLDIAHNVLRPSFYFISLRAKNGFNLIKSLRSQ